MATDWDKRFQLTKNKPGDRIKLAGELPKTIAGKSRWNILFIAKLSKKNYKKN